MLTLHTSSAPFPPSLPTTPHTPQVTQYRHSSAIKSLWLQSGITVRALLVDATLTPSVYNPVDDSLLNLPEAAHGPEHCVWDAVDGNTFVVAVGQVGMGWVVWVWCGCGRCACG